MLIEINYYYIFLLDEPNLKKKLLCLFLIKMDGSGKKGAFLKKLANAFFIKYLNTFDLCL